MGAVGRRPVPQALARRHGGHVTITLRRSHPAEAAGRGRTSLWPGLAVVAAVGLLATGLGRLVPVIGAPVIGVVLGVALSSRTRRAALTPGVQFAGKYVLQAAVVLLGAQLSLGQVAHAGTASLPVMAATLTVCLGLAFVLGRRLGIDRDLRTLIGVGTGICGASAIAAVSPVIKARSSAVSYAMSTIFLFNVAAVLAFPPLGHLLGLSQHSFGVFAGTAVNDTSSVVAAATTYGPAAAQTAVVVKLTRSLMIIPICIGLATLVRRRSTQPGPTRRLIPWFLVGFVLMAAVNSAGLVPASARPGLLDTATLLVTIALVAIGMSTDVRAMRLAGARPFVLGFLLWLAVSATSLGVQAIV
jgi:uncharacterized integral membrane protein (TIGR00698 family)